MLFNSYTFLVFFALMLILHNLPFSWKVKKTNLLIASYLFYAAWNPPFILLLWLSTIVDFYVGRALYTQNNPHKKRLLLVVSLIGNIGMLCFFKYGGFLLENFVALTNALGIPFHPAKPNIILPAGISFYTFTTLCYTIDMYKKKSKPVGSFLDFALFVTFFPHLVAGPIVRPPQLVPQFESPRKATSKQLFEGLFLLTIGLFMKVVLADSMLSGTADAVFSGPGRLPAVDAWSGVLAFSAQIFFDFAGYSTCAIGAALCLGFVLPQNFRYPYAAIGFSDFWRRWHITLSSWLKDYLYIPLGGNRKGRARTYFNLMVTMLLGGLWHGANWTFVVWGGLHGLYLWVEKFFQDTKTRIGQEMEVEEPAVVGGRRAVVQASMAPGLTLSRSGKGFVLALLTFFLVNVTWVFFRAPNFEMAGQMLTSMFGGVEGAAPVLTTLAIGKVAVIVTGMVLVHWFMRERRMLDLVYRMPWWVTGVLWAVVLLAIVLTQSSSASFIYFNFRQRMHRNRTSAPARWFRTYL